MKSLTIFALAILCFSISSAQLSGWLFKRQVTIDNRGNSSNLNNYQIKITFNHAEMVLSGQSNTNASDIRFIDSDSSRILHFWIESGVNTTACIAWVLIPTIPSNSIKYIWLYHGNPTAQSSSDGDSVFIFFDDFRLPNLSNFKWNLEGIQGAAGYSISTSGSGVIRIYTNQYRGSASLRSVSTIDFTNTVTEMMVAPYSGNTLCLTTLGIVGDPAFLSNTTYAKVFQGYTDAYARHRLYVNGNLASSGTKYPNSTALRYSSLTITTSSVFGNYDGEILQSLQMPTYTNCYLYAGWFYDDYGSTNGGVVMDWVRVRKYSTIDPAVTVASSSISTDVSELVSPLPSQYFLFQNYPNPFNPTTTIEYYVPIASFVKLSVFDILGREIAILANGNIQAGKHRVTFDASSFAAGVYFYRLQAGKFQETRKLILLK